MDSDSSSDDEFATAGSITRRKLLESFYGQSVSVAVDLSAATDSPSRNASRTISKAGTENGNALPVVRVSAADAKDLDSPYFDVAAHTSHHVVKSSVHQLLEMDEQLTLQVRTLDSTTQNMVYENYSKFIDATDAVKSVGVNVQANEQGLMRLQKGMETINEQSRVVDDDLGSLRDAVAEKIRVKRLLTRLDALLKLPETLRNQISAGYYMTAASSFCRSTNILSKQSAGFESLQKIEAECNEILAKMIKDLNKKILHWSGHESALGLASSNSDDEDSAPEALEAKTEEDEIPPDPPASISEIFECAGTLSMLVRENVCWDVGISVEDCMALSLKSAARFLDRQLDTHQLEIQDISLTTTIPPSVDESGAFEGDTSGRSQQSHKGQHLVPTAVADSILEAATLFRVSFKEKSQQKSEREIDPLEGFVKEAYSSFLAHVRSILLDYTLGARNMQQGNNDDEQDGDGDELYEDVAGAMSILIHAVRELASGLSLPEVGVRGDVAASFVEQASDLTEALVRRRVDQKFCDLRLRVLSHCLVPFATRIIGAGVEGGDGESPGDEHERSRMLQVVQIAVSDCLQLLDDTVRSIVSGRDELGGSVASVDLPMLKQSIQASTGRFASWLAGTLEVLSGCESSDSNFAFEASELTKAVDNDGLATEEAREATASGQDDISEMSDQYDALAERIDDALQDLIQTLEGKNNALDFTLKMVEMCRGCERAFAENMIESIESNVGGGKKGRSNGLFDDKKSSVVLSEHERRTTGRFRLAASRILILYATNHAFDAAGTVCPALCIYAETEGASFPDGPSEGAFHVLEIAKQASQDCDTLFGESKRPNPLPSFTNIIPTSQPLGMSLSPLKGLQLDVERMFKDKISIYPHTTHTLDFSRDAILFLFFKVVIKAVAEQARLCSFTSDGYSHLLIDVEFLREMVSHYVDKDYQVEGANACSSLSSLLTEVLNVANERCEADVVPEELTMTAISSLSEFMKLADHSRFALDA